MSQFVESSFSDVLGADLELARVSQSLQEAFELVSGGETCCTGRHLWSCYHQCPVNTAISGAK